jgi:hypothetical protein
LHFTQVTGKKLVKTTLVEGGGGQVKETKKEARVKTFQLRTSGHRKLVTLSQFKTPVHAVTD